MQSPFLHVCDKGAPNESQVYVFSDAPMGCGVKARVIRATGVKAPYWACQAAGALGGTPITATSIGKEMGKEEGKEKEASSRSAR